MDYIDQITFYFLSILPIYRLSSLGTYKPCHCPTHCCCYSCCWWSSRCYCSSRRSTWAAANCHARHATQLRAQLFGYFCFYDSHSHGFWHQKEKNKVFLPWDQKIAWNKKADIKWFVRQCIQIKKYFRDLICWCLLMKLFKLKQTFAILPNWAHWLTIHYLWWKPYAW